MPTDAPDYKKDFASFDGRIWLNAASEGPLPLAAARALHEAVEWKSKPHLLDIPKFVNTQAGLKRSLGQLIGVDPSDVILGTSASYGLHLLADGIDWKPGDEVIVMQNDFPADILPWLALEQKGVSVLQVKPKDTFLTPGELSDHISDKTKLFCISHVHSFTGFRLDPEAFARVCRDNGTLFVLNITQSVGTMPVDVSVFSVDAVVAAGYKWLCGPYGTGFAWIRPELRKRLTVNRAYWPVVLSEEELKSEDVLVRKEIDSARKLDMFGTANFFNFVPLKAAVDYWLGEGLDHVRTYHDRLIDAFIARLDKNKYTLISPPAGLARSSLTVLSHKVREKNGEIFRSLKQQGIYPAFWKGNLRVAAHVYNTADELEHTADALNGVR